MVKKFEEWMKDCDQAAVTKAQEKEDVKSEMNSEFVAQLKEKYRKKMAGETEEAETE